MNIQIYKQITDVLWKIVLDYILITIFFWM